MMYLHLTHPVSRLLPKLVHAVPEIFFLQSYPSQVIPWLTFGLDFSSLSTMPSFLSLFLFEPAAVLSPSCPSFFDILYSC